MKNIFMLTGPQNSGKSTKLMNWSQKQDNIIGIICPRDRGNRELFSIFSQTYKEFEVENESDSVQKIGKYKFLKNSFDWAEKELLKALSLKPRWIVIDEIGPLELQGKGFDKILRKLLIELELKSSNLMLVVRNS